MSLRAVVLNDCSRASHFGTRLVIDGLRTAAARAGIVIQRTFPLGFNRWDSAFDRAVDESDLVLLNGEGTCHHDAPNAIRLFAGAARAKARGKPVVLLNTVWEANVTLAAQLRHVDLAFVRESRSAAALTSAGVEAVVVPDLSLAAAIPRSPVSDGRPVVFDSVVDSTALQLAWFAAEAGDPFFPMRRWFGGLTLRRPWSAVGAAWANRSFMRPFGEASLEQLRRAPFVVTGRYHGACLAVLLEKPFLALATNSHKLIGLCEDAGIPDAMVRDFDGLAPRVAELRRAPEARAAITNGVTRYLGAAAAAHDRMFGAIAGLA